MHETTNPYQSPETEAIPDRPLLAHGSITETMLVHLKKASPWLRFVGIVGFIFTGIMLLTGLFMIPFTTTYAHVNIPGFEQFSRVGLVFNLTLLVYGFGGGALCFFLSFFIYKFGDKIRTYLRTGAESDLEIALINNSRLWRMLGIICIVGLSIVPLTIIGTIIMVAAMILN